MSTTTLSTKGQLVIPREVRRAQGLVPGMTFEIEVEAGCIILRPVPEVPRVSLDELIGAAGYVGPLKTLEDMEQGIANGARARG